MTYVVCLFIEVWFVLPGIELGINLTEQCPLTNWCFSITVMVLLT